MDPRTFGSVVHDALARFFDAEFARRARRCSSSTATDAEAIPRLRAALDAALEASGETSVARAPLAGPRQAGQHGADADALPRLRDRMTTRSCSTTDTKNAFVLRTGVEKHELSFRRRCWSGAAFGSGSAGRSTGWKSGIDERVDVGPLRGGGGLQVEQVRRARRGKKKAWDEGVVLQVPLYAHALSTLRPGTVVSRVEYRALKQRETVHTLQLVSVDRKTKTLRTDGEEEDQMEAALDAVVRHVRECAAVRSPPIRRPPAAVRPSATRATSAGWPAARGSRSDEPAHPLATERDPRNGTATCWWRPAPAPARPPPSSGASSISSARRSAGERIASPVDLQDIGAITFTNAAAADLKRKLREALREAGLGDIAYQVDNARIGTIHGFCGDILRESALRSGRNPGMQVLEEGESGSLAAEAVRDALIEALED